MKKKNTHTCKSIDGRRKNHAEVELNELPSHSPFTLTVTHAIVIHIHTYILMHSGEIFVKLIVKYIFMFIMCAPLHIHIARTSYTRAYTHTARDRHMLNHQQPLPFTRSSLRLTDWFRRRICSSIAFPVFFAFLFHFIVFACRAFVWHAKDLIPHTMTSERIAR